MKYSTLGKLSIIGDLNARTGSCDDFVIPTTLFENYISSFDVDCIDVGMRHSDDTICNASGIKLLDICKSTDLRIVNRRIGDESGRYTFLVNTGKSVIDHAIVSCTLFPIIQYFIVHEYFSCSAHAPIQVTFNINCDITHCK